MKHAPITVSIVLTIILAAAAGLVQPQGEFVSPFEIRKEMIPMRDGIRLNTRIFIPRDQPEPLPIILIRSPYGVAGAEGNFVTALKTLADEGYIFAFQDIRGKFESEGEFVMQRPAREPGDSTALDEGTDTYDTIEWMLENVTPNNGRVGIIGVSYLGWTTVVRVDGAPSCVEGNLAPGFSCRHVGSRTIFTTTLFRLSYSFEYAYQVDGGQETQRFPFDRYDTSRPVHGPGAALQCQPAALSWEDPNLERLRGPSRLRRLLEASTLIPRSPV